MDTSKVTRFEVIDQATGRLLTRYDVRIVVELQDDDRTLKVFLWDTDEARDAFLDRMGHAWDQAFGRRSGDGGI